MTWLPRAGEVQRERRHVAAEVVDAEHQVLGQVLLAAPHHETDARVGQAVLVAADVDRHHARQPEVPFQFGMQERHDEAAAGRVDVHRDVHPPVGGQFVQRRADLGDRLEFTGVGGAQDRHHPDGVLVDGVDHLLGRDDVAALLHRQVAGFDVEVAAELLPHHLDVGAHHQVGGALFPAFADLRAPPPFHRQPAQHHRLAGADRRHPDGAGRDRRRAGPRRGTGRRPCRRSAARSPRSPGIRPCRSCSCRTSRPSACPAWGSIQVVTKVARFSRELPSSISSSWMKR